MPCSFLLLAACFDDQQVNVVRVGGQGRAPIGVHLHLRDSRLLQEQGSGGRSALARDHLAEVLHLLLTELVSPRAAHLHGKGKRTLDPWDALRDAYCQVTYAPIALPSDLLLGGCYSLGSQRHECLGLVDGAVTLLIQGHLQLACLFSDLMSGDDGRRAGHRLKQAFPRLHLGPEGSLDAGLQAGFERGERPLPILGTHHAQQARILASRERAVLGKDVLPTARPVDVPRSNVAGRTNANRMCPDAGLPVGGQHRRRKNRVLLRYHLYTISAREQCSCGDGLRESGSIVEGDAPACGLRLLPARSGGRDACLLTQGERREYPSWDLLLPQVRRRGRHDGDRGAGAHLLHARQQGDGDRGAKLRPEGEQTPTEQGEGSQEQQGGRDQPAHRASSSR